MSKPKCTMQWGNPEFDYDADLKDQSDEVIAARKESGGYEVGCKADAVYELRQNHRDGNNKILKTTYHLGFNCEAHIPKKDVQNYVIKEIK